jgi:drug/metabolite transporter (DMT)-like permease
MLKFILLSILIILSASSAFLLGETIKTRSIIESFFFNSLVYFLIAMALCFIFGCTGFISNDNFKGLTKEEIYSYVVLAVVYITTGLLTSYLYKNYSVAEIAPYKNALIPLLQFIIGFMIFKDKPTYQKVIGGILMVIGIYIFSLSKK